jgi:hypothetical protein
VARVLVQPDLQIPFHHQDAIPFLLAVSDKYKCNEFVNIGDEVDFSTLSVSHLPDPDGIGFKEEFRQTLEYLKELYKVWPKMKVCVSNHTIRPLKKALYAGVPSVFMKSYQEFLGAPNTWIWRDEWEIDGVLYIHGEGFSGPNGHSKAADGHRQSTVIGHIHSGAGINYLNNKRNELIFGMNVGCLIDVKSYAFKYQKTFPRKPTLGCGVVIDGVPQFIPMLLNSRDRWMGKI